VPLRARCDDARIAKNHQQRHLTPPHELPALWKSCAEHPENKRHRKELNKLIADAERRIEADKIRLSALSVRWD
jgi:hypothetical protein